VGKSGFDVRLDGEMIQIEAEKKVGEQTREYTYLPGRVFSRLSRTAHMLQFPVDSVGKVEASEVGCQ